MSVDLNMTHFSLTIAKRWDRASERQHRPAIKTVN
jgi:hypothetical protein